MGVSDVVVDVSDLLGICVEEGLIHVELLSEINDFLRIILILTLPRVLNILQPQKNIQYIIYLLVVHLIGVLTQVFLIL